MISFLFTTEFPKDHHNCHISRSKQNNREFIHPFKFEMCISSIQAIYIIDFLSQIIPKIQQKTIIYSFF